jgi:GT2 family glycosyltransferase
MTKGKAVTIVVPVYADWPSIQDCIASLKKWVDTSRHKIIFVNDCGLEADTLETNIKDAINGWENVYYYRNPRNLGFVKTCNKAVFEYDKTDNNILLLNSDTEVTEGFLDELIWALYSQEKVAAVSPRSNNASITTIPLSTAIKRGIDPQKSYKIFQKIKEKLPRTQEVPVAHGFCMLIRRGSIKKYGLFDEVFGRGYGEEVDFCMRLRKHGYKCLLSNRAYVFHLEARSFSLEEKAKILKESEKFIDGRYPGYRQLVRDYMKEAVPRESRAESSAGFIKSIPYRAARKVYKKLRNA